MKAQFCNIQDFQHTDGHICFIFSVITLFTKAMWLSLTVLIPNYLLVIFLILTTGETQAQMGG